ncbi:unnamed protein product [Cylindrotheca closterium]|uniref:PPIase cyclophilin-type domain-containing protein n=1 Tax=Cylindrotheca closterium TaxID=2856 RepID=A0AAD2CVD0_9STRA|nr:unnamed protein product [Cylindrotheca closterium]
MQRRRPKAKVAQNDVERSPVRDEEKIKRRKRRRSGNSLRLRAAVCLVTCLAFTLTAAAVKMTMFEHAKEAQNIPLISSAPEEETEATPKAPEDSKIVECEISTKNWNSDEAASGILRIAVHKNAPSSELFLYLVSEGYYDDNYIFRVIKGFHAQWGFHTPSDMKQWWSRIEEKRGDFDSENEKTDLKNVKGTVTMIRGGAPQVFLNLGSAPWLDEEGTLPLGVVDLDSLLLADKIYTGYTPGSGQIPAMSNGTIPELFPKMSKVEKCSLV